ncbi:MAG: response regulator [Sedimentisphaerales bacterium]|nr:response regulator [Sedimentisphaerales bacterium]
MRILVVDDDFINRKYLVTLLRPLGECDVAVNGLEAVAAYESALDAEEPYDLLCLDIMMPEMDGMQALKEIRRLEVERDILELDGAKVIMTTAVDQRKNIMEAFRAGCESYLIKPVKKDKLYEEIVRLGFDVDVAALKQ